MTAPRGNEPLVHDTKRGSRPQRPDRTLHAADDDYLAAIDLRPDDPDPDSRGGETVARGCRNRDRWRRDDRAIRRGRSAVRIPSHSLDLDLAQFADCAFDGGCHSLHRRPPNRVAIQRETASSKRASTNRFD